MSQKLEGQDVYALFDEKTMEIISEESVHPYQDNDDLLSTINQVKKGLIEIGPEQKIVDDQIVNKTLEEKLKEGLIELEKDQKIENDQIVTKTLNEQVTEGLLTLEEPFEFIQNNEIKYRSAREAVESNLIKTKPQAEKALRMLNSNIEKKIAAIYPQVKELQITKDYLDWMTEKKPKKDLRKETYIKMQMEIKKIKTELRPVKEHLKKIIETANEQ